MAKQKMNYKKEFIKMDKKFMNSDKILGRDILTFPNKINAGRNVMFNSTLDQYVVLTNPEFPNVFTNYENQVGEHSTSLVKRSNFKVIAKIERNINRYVLVIELENGKIDIVERKVGVKLTEDYAYKNINKNIDSLQEGDEIEGDYTLYHSTSFDDIGNFMYGVNLNLLYLISNETIEDAIELSESAAKKLTSIALTEVEVTINTNDILLNIYGESGDTYASFPNIGEETLDLILLARRLVEYNYALHDLQTKNLKEINYLSDTIFYVPRGEVVDIEVFSNNSKLDTPYTKQIEGLLDEQFRYNSTLIKVLEPYIEKGVCTDNTTFAYRKATDYIKHCTDVDKDGNFTFKYRYNKNEFSNLVLKFTIMSDCEVHVGDKLTGRMGNKGVVSKITPDEEMPITKSGVRAEMIVNALGVGNRLNIAQNFEQEINFITRCIQIEMKKVKTIKEKRIIVFELIKDINKKYYNYLVKKYNKMNVNEKKKFILDMQNKTIYMHQPPFWGNLNLDDMIRIYNKYMEKYQGNFKPEECTVNGVPMEKPLIIAKEYIQKLKHKPRKIYCVMCRYN